MNAAEEAVQDVAMRGQRVRPVRLSMGNKAVNAARAGGRVVGAFVTGKQVTVSAQEKQRRLAICQGCDHFDGTCKLCGCVATWKTKLATEHCPLNPPKW